MRKQRQRKAFTMIEMMVVCFVIAILVGISIPAYMQAQLKAKEAKARQNLYSIYQAQRDYWFTIDDSTPNGVPFGTYANNLTTLLNVSEVTDDDGDWLYYVTAGDATGFSAEAQLQNPGGGADPLGREMYIDQTGSITKNY